jgi:hypothetical protein
MLTILILSILNVILRAKQELYKIIWKRCTINSCSQHSIDIHVTFEVNFEKNYVFFRHTNKFYGFCFVSRFKYN